MEGIEIKEPQIATDYVSRDVQAAYTVLIELGQLLGPYEDNYVIVGGSVPWLLLDEASPAHLGTLDVDIGLDSKTLNDGKYATLIETLEKAGYIRGIEGLKPFQLIRFIQIDAGEKIPVVVDLLASKDDKIKGHRPPLVPGLRVQQIDGCEIALANAVRKKIEGEMPDGRNNSVEIPVASIAALLVMKGYALSKRDKMKDAYDIYYSVRNYVGGPKQLAHDCRELLDQPIAERGFSLLASKFKSRDDFGPQTVRRFLEEAPEEFSDLEPEQVQTDAFEQVAAFLTTLDLK